MDLQADADRRSRIYRGLEARNRVVSVLRIAVPAMGALVLAGLMGQIYLSSLGARFGIGQISVTRDSVLVEAPEYTGLLDDGTTYHVAASAAQASTEASNRIHLEDARLTTRRPDGVSTLVTADAAVLDIATEAVEIAGVAHVEDSEGTRARIENSVFDYQAQILVGEGPVVIDYADGSHLEAEGLRYDVQAMIWTFTRASVTLPETPGAEKEPQ